MGKLDQQKRDKIPSKNYAFPKEEKEPLNDAAHVRNAIARFNQVKGVTEAERDEAWKRIRAAAKKFGVEMEEKSWHELSHSADR
jgi:cell division protein FtsX